MASQANISFIVLLHSWYSYYVDYDRCCDEPFLQLVWLKSLRFVGALETVT